MAQLTKKQKLIIVDGIANYYSQQENIDMQKANFIFLLNINNLDNISNNYQAFHQKINEELSSGDYEEYNMSAIYKMLIKLIDKNILDSIVENQYAFNF